MAIPTQDRPASVKKAREWFFPEWHKDAEFTRRLALRFSEAQIDEMLLLCVALHRLCRVAQHWPLQPGNIDPNQLAVFEESCAAVVNAEAICRDFLSPAMKRIVSDAVPYAREISGPCPVPWDPICGGLEERGDMLCGIIFGAISVILGELTKCGREAA